MSGRTASQRITQRLRRAGLTVEGPLAEQLSAYIGLLTKWNRHINLTSLPLDPLSDQAVDRLVVEPVAAAKWASRKDQLSIDVGSGGGSPAIPFKLAAPWLRLVMVEAKTRKSAFLREAVRELSLRGDEVCNTSLEELLSRPDLNEAADLITLRAVRADARLWATVEGLLRPDGRLFWFGSSEAPAPTDGYPSVFGIDARETLVPALGSSLTILRRRLSSG